MSTDYDVSLGPPSYINSTPFLSCHFIFLYSIHIISLALIFSLSQSGSVPLLLTFHLHLHTTSIQVQFKVHPSVLVGWEATKNYKWEGIPAVTSRNLGRVFGHQRRMKNFSGILLSMVMVVGAPFLSKQVLQHSTTPSTIKSVQEFVVHFPVNVLYWQVCRGAARAAGFGGSITWGLIWREVHFH